MITGELRNQIDKLWTEFWTGGITNPLTVIEQISFLMFAYQLELVSEITRSLSMKYGTPDYGTDFWNPKSLDEIIETNPAGPISDIEALAGNFWPDEESVDDFNQYIYSQRRENRIRHLY